MQCRVDVERQQNEETYTTKDGETVSYQPPVYKYEFDYTMRIKVKTPWFDDMDFRLNTFSISSDNRGELMEVEQTGHQIIAALTPNAAGMQQPGGLWKCQCGAENTGRFCEYCGQPRPF